MFFFLPFPLLFGPRSCRFSAMPPYFFPFFCVETPRPFARPPPPRPPLPLISFFFCSSIVNTFPAFLFFFPPFVFFFFSPPQSLGQELAARQSRAIHGVFETSGPRLLSDAFSTTKMDGYWPLFSGFPDPIIFSGPLVFLIPPANLFLIDRSSLFAS